MSMKAGMTIKPFSSVGERLLYTQDVRGSNPLGATKGASYPRNYTGSTKETLWVGETFWEAVK